MNRILTLAALTLSASLPLAAQEEAPRPQHYRYRVESPYRDYGKMGREFGRMGREYGRMGREYARMYSRDFSRQWSRQDFGRGFRNFSRDMTRSFGRMGREFRGSDWSRMGREWGRMGREFHMRPRRGDI